MNVILDDFLLTNLWWIILASCLLMFGLVFLVDFLVRKRKKGMAEAKKERSANLYLEALGGKENIVSSEIVGSRIVLVLKDYSIDKEKLKEAGVAGFIQMSNKLTLVIKDDAEDTYRRIFE